ncbi:hypothetical protein M2149_000787 [Lachnospiraceae bacterium PFB1-21]
MRITPYQMDMWTYEMSEFYNSLEGEIIRSVIKRLNNGYTNITEWQAQALKDLRLFNSDVVKELAKMTPYLESEIKRYFEVAGNDFIHEIDEYMTYESKPFPSDLDDVMRSYSSQCWREIDNYVNQTLVTTNYGEGGRGTATQAYVDVLNRTQALFNTGLLTLDEALEQAIKELAKKGIKSTFIDKGDHTWSLERYVQTVLSSTLANTYNELRTSRMAEYGVHTVVVTSHMGARPACSRIQGNVVDLRMPWQIPEGSEYLSIYDATWGADYGTAGGHRGCNCRHSHIPFIPGANTNNQPQYDATENAEVAKLRTKQRDLERRMVRHKKDRMISAELGNIPEIKRLDKLIKGTDNRLTELVASNKWLNRDRNREKVYTPLEILLADHNE